jgi:site-specific DNA recombinase
VRLVVKEVLIGDDAITIRHSIPVPSGPPQKGGPPPLGRSQNQSGGQSYLLRKGSDYTALWNSLLAGRFQNEL